MSSVIVGRSYVEGEPYIYFGSTTKTHYQLSNFFYVEDGVTVNGITYPSTEHAFQAQKFIEKERFSVNGDLGSPEGFSVVYGPVGNKKKEYWMKKKAIGILAWLVAHKKQGFPGLTRDPKYKYVDENWLTILRAKYQNPALKKLLIDTGNTYLIEFNRSSDSFWGGFVKDAKLNGTNHMGQLIMLIRDELKTD